MTTLYTNGLIHNPHIGVTTPDPTGHRDLTSSAYTV